MKTSPDMCGPAGFNPQFVHHHIYMQPMLYYSFVEKVGNKLLYFTLLYNNARSLREMAVKSFPGYVSPERGWGLDDLGC